MVAGLHVPMPSQAWDVSVPPAQLVVPHIVPAAATLHPLFPLHPVPVLPHAPSGGHWFFGSVPAAIGPHVPSLPWPFRAAVQAWQVPVQAVSQHTPSAQLPLVQSLPALHFFPLAQRVGHPAVGPPQSTSVSPPSFVPSLHETIPWHPSEMGPPQVLPSWEHVCAVQPHAWGVPPPPQVSGGVQSAFVLQPHRPWALHVSPFPQGMPGFGVFTTCPPEHEVVVHVVVEAGGSFAGCDVWPPLPSQTISMQSPMTCGGVVVVARPAAA
jgi:hypothetical protein